MFRARTGIATGLAVVAALMAGIGSAGAQPGDGTQPGPPQTAQPLQGVPGSSLPCTSVAPSSMSVLPNGATQYVYNLPGGAATTLVPSATLDPLSATNDQLLANGYPPRPADTASAAYAQWSQVVQNYQVTVGSMCVSQAEAGATGGSNNIDGQQWAGEISQSSALQPYTEATGQWYQTGFRETCGNYNEGEASWAGIGGTGNTNLAQAGIITDIAVGGGGLHMFWENWPQRNAVYFGGTVHSGDLIYSDVYVSGGVSYFYVKDFTTGAVGNTHITYTPNQSTSEFIDEAPKFNNNANQAVLRHWYNGNVKWTDAHPDGTDVGAYYHHNTFMHLYSGGPETAGPDNGMINNYSFYDYWHHCYNTSF